MVHAFSSSSQSPSSLSPHTTSNPSTIPTKDWKQITHILCATPMAVEGRHINLLPSQFTPTTTRQALEGNGSPIGQSWAGETGGSKYLMMVPPLYNSAIVVPPKADTGLTYHLNLPVSRKRAREESRLMSFPFPFPDSFSFLGQDISLQIQHQQLEIDRFISLHMENVRVEIEERRKRHWRRMIGAVEERLMKRLKAKEEEVEKIGKWNWALEERVKSLSVENQIWRDLAQTNEANAHALRNNLEQVLSEQVKTTEEQQQQKQSSKYVEMEGAESGCGSTSGGGENNKEEGESGEEDRKRRCRNCGREEATVLVLPCRHMCLCTECDSALLTCPICSSNKTATVHVNLS